MSQKLGQQHEHGTDSDTESEEEDDLEQLARRALPGREEHDVYLCVWPGSMIYEVGQRTPELTVSF